MRRRVGEWLRRWADRIDDAGAPRAIGWRFTFERNEGIRFREDGRGCRLWYLGEDDYERAHTEADKPAVRIPWAALTDPDLRVRLVDSEGNGVWEIARSGTRVMSTRMAPGHRPPSASMNPEAAGE